MFTQQLKRGESMARPTKFKNAEELQKKIDEYFDSISYEAPIVLLDYPIDEEGNVLGDKIPMTLKGKDGKVVYQKKYWKPPTGSGLAAYIGIDRTSLINYGKRDEFFDTIKNVRAKLQDFYEERMIENGHAGNIFAAKNFGFTDKQEISADIKANEFVSAMHKFIEKI